MRFQTLVACAAAASCMFGQAQAARVLEVDASRQPGPPEAGYLHMGTDIAPDGTRLQINSRYLTLGGKPWLPVMGEFHYSRYPADEWDGELERMKLAGVDIVSTYVIWSHHQPQPGPFDWRGDRDLRRFVQLAASHGLKVMVRLGPWVHAEVRYGGVPEWVVQSTRTRSDDGAYMADVGELYRQIGTQLHGLLWKDGGPIIGVQIENEYNLTGEGQGREHIAALKRLAVQAGLDAPLYTVTGWDDTVYPAREVTPVFGGYPDLPWGTSRETLPPSETYAFRFGSRVTGDLGAQTAGGEHGDADADAAHTPYLTAEYGAGMGPFYRRRTWTTAEDGAALLPVQLGSGVNMFGYYMFHGGRNPQQPGGWQESTATGGYNDLPLVNYDLSAPLGEYGQENPLLRAVRPYHLFLQAFGDRLAPMPAFKPQVPPSSAADLTTPRFSVRALGDSGFLFFNSHVRQHPMAAQQGVQFRVKLATRTVTFPDKPVDLKPDSGFIWPIGMDLDGVQLLWASAQPMARIPGRNCTTYVFSQTKGVTPTFAFVGSGMNSRAGSAGRLKSTSRDISYRRLTAAGRAELFTVASDHGPVCILVLPEATARAASVVRLGGRERLVVTDASVVSNRPDDLGLRSVGANHVAVSVYPGDDLTPVQDGAFRPIRGAGPLTSFVADLPARTLAVQVHLVAPPRVAPPVRIGGAANAAVEPAPEAFGASGRWRIDMAQDALAGLADAYLDIHYTGDEARLLDGGRLLDDQFYDGRSWRVGLKRYLGKLDGVLTLSVMPLRRDSPIYLQPEAVPVWAAGETQRAAVTDVTVTPVYQTTLRFRSGRDGGSDAAR